MSKKSIYKIIFQNQGKIYDIYARNIYEGEMFGFVVVEQLIFGERSKVVLDPAEESLKSEFDNVLRTYIPMHTIIRIDEVEKEGAAKITLLSDSTNNVTTFPIYTPSKDTK